MGQTRARLIAEFDVKTQATSKKSTRLICQVTVTPTQQISRAVLSLTTREAHLNLMLKLKSLPKKRPADLASDDWYILAPRPSPLAPRPSRTNQPAMDFYLAPCPLGPRLEMIALHHLFRMGWV